VAGGAIGLVHLFTFCGSVRAEGFVLPA